jgi:lipid II:glycine glycyltransferase (peptidoglycan interpeptide bridge formation enzyme)
LSKIIETNAKNLKARLADLCNKFSDRVDLVRLRFEAEIAELEVAKAPIQKELNRYAWDWEDCFGLTSEIKKKIEPYNNEIKTLTEKRNDNTQLAEIVLD